MMFNLWLTLGVFLASFVEKDPYVLSFANIERFSVRAV